jgi:dUTP pyrophosphatase
LANSIGVIDPGYRGEIILKFKPAGYFASVPTDTSEGNVSETFDFVCFGKEDVDDDDNCALYSIGDRIGQILIIPRPTIEWEEVYELSATERGAGGFGSTNTSGSTGGAFQGSHTL